MNESQLAELAPEQLVAISEEFKSRINLDSERSWTSEEIKELFNFFRVSLAIGDHEKAAEVFKAIQIICHRFFDEGSNPETAIDFLLEWSIMAVGVTVEKLDEFVCMPVYLDMIEVLEQAPEELAYKGGRMYLQLASHYQQWKDLGGDTETTPGEELAILEFALENHIDLMDNFLEQAEARGNFDDLLMGHRALFRYFVLQRKPNDAVAQMKEIIEVLPQTTDYHVSETADAYMSLGQLFLQFKKFQTAHKYFDLAREVFEGEGEEWEMHMYQAEGWMEECEKHF